MSELHGGVAAAGLKIRSVLGSQVAARDQVLCPLWELQQAQIVGDLRAAEAIDSAVLEECGDLGWGQAPGRRVGERSGPSPRVQGPDAGCSPLPVARVERHGVILDSRRTATIEANREGGGCHGVGLTVPPWLARSCAERFVFFRQRCEDLAFDIGHVVSPLIWYGEVDLHGCYFKA